MRVFHCDDSDAYRELLVTMLSTHESIDLVGGASSPFTAMRDVARIQPDIVLLDAEMEGNGPEVIAHMRRTAPSTKVIILSGRALSAAPLFAAADGYVSKEESFDEIATAIRQEFWRS